MSTLLEISEQLQKGKSKMVKELVERAIAEEIQAEQILNEGLLDGACHEGGDAVVKAASEGRWCAGNRPRVHRNRAGRFA